MPSYNFRELVRPGSSYEFVDRSKTWFTVSMLLIAASVALLFINVPLRGSMLNWSIDFKGGTEIIASFEPSVDNQQIRTVLEEGGYPGADVSRFDLNVEGEELNGFLIRLAIFGAVTEEKSETVSEAFAQKFADREVQKTQWSGDQFFVRSKQPVSQAEVQAFFTEQGLEMKPWSEDEVAEYETPSGAAGEYEATVGLFGLDREIENLLTEGLGGPVEIRQVDAVGARAGEKLRNQGAASLLYAIAFILLYIAFRFDLRFGPGAILALLHDAMIVVGIFALFWVEVSLTTVAALLTVIGYSINDTIVIFDRIRENEGRLKDKKLGRVINISVNETMSRSLLTSSTTFVVTLAMFMLGTGLVKNFALAMTVGVLVGTYSSIFVASPLMLWLHRRYFAHRNKGPKTTRRTATTS